MMNWTKKVFSFALLFCTGLMASSAFASSISVNPMRADLTYQTRYQDIQVENTGDDTAYVAVTVYRVNNAGMPNQTFTALSDNPYAIGLIVTPNKMVIPVGQMRIARALYIGKPLPSDVVYEVKFTPVSGNLVTIGNANSNVSAGVELVIAYGVSIIVRPVEMQPQITATRNGTALTLKNTGNTAVLVGACKQCTSDLNCQTLSDIAARLHPGNSIQFTLPKDLPLTCQEQILANQFFPLKIP